MPFAPWSNHNGRAPYGVIFKSDPQLKTTAANRPEAERYSEQNTLTMEE